ncbi:MAG: glycosyltransferase family 39 protein, partial [Deltaproteobacteria bacterium]|nr:glycosyltransferase family 39 protein [Deltaproteobacteria bacterium]
MSYRRLTIAVLAAFLAFRVVYLLYTPFGVSPDEAHYWEWSRRLGLSYYSKGPGVAYVIAFFTSIFGDNAFGIRFGAPVFAALGGWAVFLIGKDVFESEKTGFYATLLLNITPIFSIGSILMTTDVLLVFFWASSIWCVNRAIAARRAGWWYAAGVMIGLGFLTKYTMVFLVPCVLLFLAASKKDRFWLRRYEPYAAGLLSLVVVTPVIWWNIFNGQVTIRHTMGQAHIGRGEFSLMPSLEFIGSQAGLLTPLIFIALVWGVARCASFGFGRKRSGPLLLFFACAPLFLFFFFKSLHGKVQANWAIAAYIAAYPAAVWAFSALLERGAALAKPLRAVAWVALFTAFIGSMLAYFPWALEAAGVKNIIHNPPYSNVTGWAELGGRVSEVKAGMEREAGETFIASDRYQITSVLALYTKGNPVTYNFKSSERRMNQYDL